MSIEKEPFPIESAIREIRTWYKKFPFQGREETSASHSARVTMWFHNLRNDHHLAATLIRDMDDSEERARLKAELSKSLK